MLIDEEISIDHAVRQSGERVAQLSEWPWGERRPEFPLFGAGKSSVPKEILSSVSKDEMKRQEIIFETIYTEDDYVKDLDLLDTVNTNTNSNLESILIIIELIYSHCI